MKGIECAFDARVTRDAEVRQTKAGKPFVKFSAIAIVRNDKEQPLSVLAWRDTFCDLSPDLKAGVEVYIEGSLELSEWDGEVSLSVSASKVEPKGLIGRKKPKAAGSPRAKKANGVDSQRPIERHAPAFNDSIDDLF